MTRDELLETRLPDRDPALLEALDLGLVDVDAADIAAELGEAGGGDETDVSGADDADGFSLCSRSFRGGLPYCLSLLSEAAISSIWALATPFVSVFETQ